MSVLVTDLKKGILQKKRAKLNGNKKGT